MGQKSPCLFPQIDVANEITLALTSSTATSNFDMTRDMKRLGMERASLSGWYNAYHMTKAMAEMVIHGTRGDVPVVIIRPTSICYKEPIPGWIQGNRVLDPLIISYGKAQLPAFLGHPDSHADIIPLDIVVNATIAAIAKHGLMHKPDLAVYQMASSVVNPLRYSDFFEYIYEYFNSDPLIEWESFTKINYYPDLTPIKYFENFNDFSKFTRDEISRSVGTRYPNAMRSGTLDKKCKVQSKYAENLCKLYKFIGFFKARFHAGNTQKLLSEMSKEEEISFVIDVAKIDWRKYLHEIHIPGLRKHVLNDKRICL
ncbi:hypothetical protein ACS0TY_025640 [Phlomoides rotata]